METNKIDTRYSLVSAGELAGDHSVNDYQLLDPSVTIGRIGSSIVGFMWEQYDAIGIYRENIENMNAGKKAIDLAMRLNTLRFEAAFLKGDKDSMQQLQEELLGLQEKERLLI
jgi:hypothetical protein